MVRREGRGGVEGFSGAVQARLEKICLMHSLNLGACAGFSQGYRRGLCIEEQEKETMQPQSTRNASTGLCGFFPSAASTVRNG